MLDLADGLATRTGPNGAWPPLLYEYLGLPRNGQHVGTARPPLRWLWHQPAYTRLAVLRKISHLLKVPDYIETNPPDWLGNLARRKGENFPRSLRGAVDDELILLAVRPNSSAVEELSRRSEAWPDALRRRWQGKIGREYL